MHDASGLGFSRFDVAEATRCYCNAWRGGQRSDLYARGCRLSRYYRPSPIAHDWPDKEPSGENDHVRALLAAWLWDAKPWRRGSIGFPKYWKI